MAKTNDEIKEQYSELVISKGNNEEVEAIVGSNMDFSLNAARDSENQEIVKAIIDLLKQMEKEPPTEEYPKVVYYHVKKEYAVLSYETHTRCDAIYYGIRCMYSKVASKRSKGCECINPEPEFTKELKL